MIRRAAASLFAIAVIGLALVLAWRLISPHAPGRAPAASAPVVAAVPAPAPAALAPDPAPATPAATPAPAPSCPPAPEFAAAAEANEISIRTATWAPFGRQEQGWAIYAPLAAHEIGTACQADQPGFAAALSVWQKAHGLAATGVMDVRSLDALRVLWLQRRPFVIAFRGGVCPLATDPANLVQAQPNESYGGKAIQLAPGALAAWRAMVAAARTESPAIAADPRLLTIFSGYRSPDADAAFCDANGGCGRVARVRCSAHRTGTAMDLYLGSAPGSRPESSADDNRLFQARSEAYRWLVANASRFGLVPYPFEPWHWEWTGGSQGAG